MYYGAESVANNKYLIYTRDKVDFKMLEFFFGLLCVYLIYIILRYTDLEKFRYKNQFEDGYVTKEEYEEQIKTINKIEEEKEEEKKNPPYDIIT